MRTKTTVVIFFTAALAVVPMHARAAEAGASPVLNWMSAGSADEASLYADGTRAVNESRWQDAVGLFDRVVKMRGEHAEGALYWKAYAENKEGQQANALSTCGELRKLYPKSRWIEECGALEIEIRGKSGDPMSPQGVPDENLKLLAVNALMEQDPAKAVPILEKILTGNQSEELKKRALFVLAQSHSAQAEAVISKVAQGQSGPELQVHAIHMIAAAQGKNANETLGNLYKQTSDVRVKKAILQSYLITGDSARVLEAAKQETNPELVRTAIHTLGPMGAVQDLQELYRATNNAQTKADIINALIASGHNGVAALSEIAQSEQDADLRSKAIRNLGVAGGMSVAPALVTTYQKSPDENTKRAAAQALFLANDAHDLITLARAEKDMNMKQYLVQQLSLMRDQEATDYMMEILNK
jgi:HEAT repeat protein